MEKLLDWLMDVWLSPLNLLDKVERIWIRAVLFPFALSLVFILTIILGLPMLFFIIIYLSSSFINKTD